MPGWSWAELYGLLERKGLCSHRWQFQRTFNGHALYQCADCHVTSTVSVRKSRY